MLRTQKITLLGKLRFTESDGLHYEGNKAADAITLPSTVTKAWVGDQLSIDIDQYSVDNARLKENDAKAYRKAFKAFLCSHPSYQAHAKTFIELQKHTPQRLFEILKGLYTKDHWAYRDLVLDKTPDVNSDEHKEAIMVKHFILRRERDFERVQREVEALENLEKLDRFPREPIPECVRLFVWQRDGGQCVKCYARERLEFDHIIPLVAGGSSTERNIQLLCETCNRSKGATI